MSQAETFIRGHTYIVTVAQLSRITDHGWILHLFQLDTLGRRQNNHPTNNAEQLANDKSKEYHIIKEYIINLKGKDIFSVCASRGTRLLIFRTYSSFESLNFFHLHKQQNEHRYNDEFDWRASNKNGRSQGFRGRRIYGIVETSHGAHGACDTKQYMLCLSIVFKELRIVD